MRKLIPALSLMSLFFGCSSNQEKHLEAGSRIYDSQNKSETADALMNKIQAKWFTGEKRFRLEDINGQPMAHMFYDANPNINKNNNKVGFVVTTPKGYPTEQAIDLSSGQLYLARKYCSQSDAWGKYNGRVEFPPFASGIVPRTLDQLNLPQKIIVFGEEGRYQEHFKHNRYEGRVVGGFVEQVCPKRGCVGKGSWLSRFVLIGVQPDSKTFKNVRSVHELKSLVDWPLVEAFIGSGGGRNIVGGKLYPAYRMGAVVEAAQAMAFLERNSKTFKHGELTKMRSGCHKLYDHIWNDFQKEDKLGFDKKFKKNLIEYGDRFNTCAKYVYPSSINFEAKRHWFFAYLSGYMKLNELGFYYSCDAKSWIPTPYIQGGDWSVKLKERFRFCPDGSVDKAMKRMPRFLEILKNRGFSSHRYIDYDNSSWGTHSKIYSWVPHDNKVLECSKVDSDGDAEKEEYFKNSLPNFPGDIDWESIRPKDKKEANVL